MRRKVFAFNSPSTSARLWEKLSVIDSDAWRLPRTPAHCVSRSYVSTGKTNSK